MRLADFINTQRERILTDWEAFARTLGPASDSMDIAALRDHASEMLTVIAADLATPQTLVQQRDKSHGRSPDGASAPPTAAEEHGADRADRGFTIDQMVSEYRALRASVVRLWIEAHGALGAEDIDELTRFHEAIDQALAESVARYTLDLAHSKEMFIAILGHDLRSPLSAIVTSAAFMLDLGELREPNLTLTSRIASSSRRMLLMVRDLLDLARSRLGGGIPVERAPMDMEKAVREVVSECGAAHADRRIEVSTAGDLRGEWDCARVTQVLSNLVGNAIEHGAAETPIQVRVLGSDDHVAVAVHNEGVPIPPSLQRRIFDPMKRRHATGRRAAATSSGLGLGLYIAERIVTAHNGRIELASTPSAGTTFTVRLPRWP